MNITFSPDEKLALEMVARRSIRTVEQQVRYLVVSSLMQDGLLQITDLDKTDTVEQTDPLLLRICGLTSELTNLRNEIERLKAQPPQPAEPADLVESDEFECVAYPPDEARVTRRKRGMDGTSPERKILILFSGAPDKPRSRKGLLEDAQKRWPGLSSATISRGVTRLIAQGLLTRHQVVKNNTNRPVETVKLTETGKTACQGH